MTCERSEFVTNAYKYSASVANFERMSNIFICKHIRKHIRLCVRAAGSTLNPGEGKRLKIDVGF